MRASRSKSDLSPSAPLSARWAPGSVGRKTLGRWWRLCALTFGLSAAPSAGAYSSPRAAPEVASYQLQAKLNANAHVVHGRGKISWTNPSRKPAKGLYFHLYLNAFENPETLFLRDKGGRSGVLSGTPGKTVVHSLTSPTFQGVQLWDSASSHSPGDPADRTDIWIPLPRPVAVGESIELFIEFDSHLPQIVERTGYARDFHLVAQWFPKIAKRETNGRWAHFAFHPYAEFYSDFGTYDVTLDVPNNFLVGASGQLGAAPSRAAGRKKYRFRAEGVHDFAWTAWPDFEVEIRKIQQVRVKLMVPPDTASLVIERTWATIAEGLTYFGAQYGPYPYRNLTVVHPPAFAGRAGGMEYPQLITTGGSSSLARLGARNIELLVCHELAHQWFYGVIASDETRFPFLDEGLTSYAEWKYLEHVRGDASLLDLPPLSISRTAGGRYATLQGPFDQPVELPAKDYSSFSRLASIVYGRTPLALVTLGRVYGEKKLERALFHYAKAHRFRHPRPRHFYAAIGKELGAGAEHQLKAIFRKSATIDLSVGRVESQSRLQGFHSQITLLREGALRFPFLARATLADGTTLERKFSGKEAQHTWQFEHPAALESVDVDPQNAILIDENRLNNHWKVSQALERPRLTTLLHNWLSFLLLFLSP